MGRAVGKQLYCFDFETESDCDLTACGSVVYSHHYSTEVICLCWADVAGTMMGGWAPNTLEAEPLGKLWELACNPEVIFMAHNVGFEKAIWRNIMMPRYGFPDIPDDRWHDTMAVCAEKGLPLGLDDACRALKLPEQKDKAGSKFTVGLSKEKWRKDGTKKARPDDWRQTVVDYCHQDVAAEIALHKRIGWMEPKEREVWLLDQTINARGVAVDLAFVTAAQTIVRDAIAPLASQFMEATGLKFTQTVKLLAWFKARGLHIPNMQKGTLDSILGSDEHGHDDDIDWDLYVPDLGFMLRNLLKIRQLIGSASIKKLDKMLECTWHGIAYNLLQYHGAGTGRWAGRLLQPQNFPRGVGRDMDGVVSAIMTGDHQYVDAVIGPPVEVVVGALRHALVARPGKVFVVGDFAGIEARVVLALAGQHDKTALMASGQDVYIDMANQIYNRTDITKKDIAERTIGKNAVLGCGFGMGAKKFRLRYCPLRPLSFAEEVVGAYRKKFAPKVALFWLWVENRIFEVFWPDSIESRKRWFERRAEDHDVDLAQWRKWIVPAIEGRWLTIQIPGGRKLWYANPRPREVLRPYSPATFKLHPEDGHMYELIKRTFGIDWMYPGDDDALQIPAITWLKKNRTFVYEGKIYQTIKYITRAYTYQAQKLGQWKKITAYGGLITENIVQAMARDLMVDAMQKCEAAGMPVVLTVHDEIVCEVDDNGQDWAKMLQQIMEDRPQWASDMQVPVTAECWQGDRYHK